jgi:hypothetical protein
LSVLPVVRARGSHYEFQTFFTRPRQHKRNATALCNPHGSRLEATERDKNTFVRSNVVDAFSESKHVLYWNGSTICFTLDHDQDLGTRHVNSEAKIDLVFMSGPPSTVPPSMMNFDRRRTPMINQPADEIANE